MSGLQPYDAVLLLSFGGPEQPDDVFPFLENVTQGRGIPRERLTEVAGHYLNFGGRSPINDQNRALLAALRAELTARGIDVPVVWGNRNWQPYVAQALREAHAGGARRVLVLVTSAYPSYSGCRQYREDLAAAVRKLADEGRLLAVDKVRHFANHPGFVEPSVDAVIAALGQLPPGDAESARVLFVTHSIPQTMAAGAGPHGGQYVDSHLDVAATVADRVGSRLGRQVGWDLVYCSRSGPPGQPWLAPDINDHLVELAAAGSRAVVAVPIGFISDHMEVVFDLDTQAAQTAADQGMGFVRAATAGVDPRFVAALVDLLVERAAAEREDPVARPSVGGLGPWHDVCPAGCCPNARGDRPAACGRDYAGPLLPTGTTR